MKVMNQKDVKQECFIETHYKVDHSKATEREKSTFATIGSMFEGKPVCAYCLGRLSWMADSYGYSNQRDLRGGANAGAILSSREAIARSPLKAVFEDIDLTELNWQLDHNLIPMEADPKAIQPPIQNEIDRLNGVRVIHS